LIPCISIDLPRDTPHLAVIGKVSALPLTWGNGGQAFVGADQGTALERIAEFVAEKAKGPQVVATSTHARFCGFSG
jgi:hypothetical protein